MAAGWNLRPQEASRIKVYGKEYEAPRRTLSYGGEYAFSGQLSKVNESPQFLQPFIDRANLYFGRLNIPGRTQFLINWYEPHEYICAHQDDESNLVKSKKGEMIIISFTLQEGNPRIFRMKPKGKGTNRLDVTLEDGAVVLMGGLTQQTHTHAIPKKKGVGRRINITFRKHQ